MDAGRRMKTEIELYRPDAETIEQLRALWENRQIELRNGLGDGV